MPNKPEASQSLVTKSWTFLTVQPKQSYLSSSLFPISIGCPQKQASHPLFLSHLMKEQHWLLPLQRAFCFHDGAFEAKTGVSFPHRKSQSHAILNLPYCHHQSCLALQILMSFKSISRSNRFPHWLPTHYLTALGEFYLFLKLLPSWWFLSPQV